MCKSITYQSINSYLLCSTNLFENVHTQLRQSLIPVFNPTCKISLTISDVCFLHIYVSSGANQSSTEASTLYLLCSNNLSRRKRRLQPIVWCRTSLQIQSSVLAACLKLLKCTFGFYSHLRNKSIVNLHSDPNLWSYLTCYNRTVVFCIFTMWKMSGRSCNYFFYLIILR